jgi:hypothetical protein
MADEAKKTISDIEARRAARKASLAEAREAQLSKDLARVDELETEHGDDRVVVLGMPSFVAGLPTLVVVGSPSPSVFNRFRQMVRKAAQNTEATGAAKDLLAASCVLYPDKETYERMREAWPSIHDNVGVEAIKRVEAEGKA